MTSPSRVWAFSRTSSSSRAACQVARSTTGGRPGRAVVGCAVVGCGVVMPAQTGTWSGTHRRVTTPRAGNRYPMAPISDAVVVDVLRRVDRLASPGVRRLGRRPSRSPAERDAWWAGPVSTVAAGVAAAPRFLGRLADVLPLQNTVGTAVAS